MPEKTKQIAIRVPDGMWEDIQHRLASERTKFQELGVRLLRAWLSGEKQGKARETTDGLREAPSVQWNEEHSAWHKMLEYILEHAEPEVAGFITGNLQVFFENVQLKEKGAFRVVELPRADQKAGGAKPVRGAPKSAGAKRVAQSADHENSSPTGGRGED